MRTAIVDIMRSLRFYTYYGRGRCYSSITASTTKNKSLLTLAIETSCDDTCVAILEKSGPEARLLFNKKVTSDSREHRGIHPVVAAVGHTASLADLVQESLHFLPEYDGDALSPTPISGGVISTTNKKNNNLLPSVLRRIPDFISVTRGPGMTSGLAVGLTLAKGLSVAWQRPFLGVHHMQAHALTPRLVNALDNHSPFPNPEFPFLTLLISGGHTQLLLSQSLTSHSILATTANVAIGDMLDKCAREILPAEILSSTKSTMYGAALEKFASLKLDEYKPPQQPKHFFKPFFYQEEGQEEQEKWHLTPPHILCKSKMEFDFSGLGGAVRKIFTTTPTQQQQQEPPPEIISIQERQILARETMRLSFEQLAYKTLLALQQEEQKIKTLVISGGVASNNYLRTILRSVLNHYGFSEVEIVAPPPDLCTDNAAMIAWTGMEMWEAGWESELDVLPLRKWGLDETGEDGGIMGVGGWKRREHV